MDGRRFDELARRWAEGGGSRRALARLMVGGGVAAGVARLGLDEAAARCIAPRNRCEAGDTCCDGARCRRGRCKCPGGLKACGRECVDTSRDPDHCNGCFNSCPDGPCEFGRCCQRLRKTCDSVLECCTPSGGSVSCTTIFDGKGGTFGCGFVGNLDRCCVPAGGTGCAGDCDCCGAARCQNGTCI